MKVIIPGNPIPKARARTFTKSGKSMTFDPQYAKKRMVQARLKCFIRSSFDSLDKQTVLDASNLAYNHAYEVKLVFYLRIPHSASKSERNVFSWGAPHNQKPDLDNMEKFYLDCANGILYPDDAMIVRLQSEKHFSDKPRTEIDIMPIKQKTSPSFDIIKKTLSPEELKEFLGDVKKFFTFNPEDVDKSQKSDLGYFEEQQITAISLCLINFAEKYSDTLKKIAKEKKKGEE